MKLANCRFARLIASTRSHIWGSTVARYQATAGCRPQCLADEVVCQQSAHRRMTVQRERELETSGQSLQLVQSPDGALSEADQQTRLSGSYGRGIYAGH